MKLTFEQLLGFVNSKDKARIEEAMLRYRDDWNSFIEQAKRDNLKVRLDHIVLKGADLKGLDLSSTIIEDSDFSGADLSGADISGADISGTNLSSANLSATNLYSTRISKTNMSKASLYNSNLDHIQLTGSVNIFDAYTGEFQYSTSSDRTKKGFRMAEAYEHDDGEEEGNYY